MEHAVMLRRFEYEVAFSFGGGRDVASTARIVEEQFERLAARHLLETDLGVRPIEGAFDASQVEANRRSTVIHADRFIISRGATEKRRVRNPSRVSGFLGRKDARYALLENGPISTDDR